MKNEYTHITVLLDRSGSMEPIRDDIIGGYNNFLQDQKQETGTATITLVQFDTQDPYEVIHSFKPIEEVLVLTRNTYVPRASTPLLDALGRGINDLESQIAKLDEAERPSRVIVAVVTDGQENSSREFNKSRIAQMIKEKTEKDDWQFIFLSADLSAINDANQVGFAAASSLLFTKDSIGSRGVWDSFSKKTAMYRKKMTDKIEFDDEDRTHPDDPAKKKD